MNDVTYFPKYYFINSRPTDNVVHAIYFWYSLLFLIGRTFSVSLYSSKVNDESQRPIAMIKNIPKSGWNVETERLLEQIRTDKTALSGMKYFHLTRSLILKVYCKMSLLLRRMNFFYKYVFF